MAVVAVRCGWRANLQMSPEIPSDGHDSFLQTPVRPTHVETRERTRNLWRVSGPVARRQVHTYLARKFEETLAAHTLRHFPFLLAAVIPCSSRGAAPEYPRPEICTNRTPASFIFTFCAQPQFLSESLCPARHAKSISGPQSAIKKIQSKMAMLIFARGKNLKG